MSICPYNPSSTARFIVEARNPDGSLNFDGPEPPAWMSGCSLNKLCQYWFGQHQEHPFTWDAFNLHFEERGWVIREKTW